MSVNFSWKSSLFEIFQVAYRPSLDRKMSFFLVKRIQREQVHSLVTSSRDCTSCRRAPEASTRPRIYPIYRGRRRGRSGAGAGRARSIWPWMVCSFSSSQSRIVQHLSLNLWSRLRRTWLGSASIAAASEDQSLIWATYRSSSVCGDASSFSCQTSSSVLLLIKQKQKENHYHNRYCKNENYWVILLSY